MEESRIPLDRTFMLQHSYLDVMADGITIELRGWGRFFRKQWFVPRSAVTVVARAVKVDDALEDGIVWRRPPLVPAIATGLASRCNLTLLFAPAQRIPAVRYGKDLPLPVMRSRSKRGLYLDGVVVSAVDPTAAVETLRRYGYDGVEDGKAWLRDHHPVTVDPRAVAATARRARRSARVDRARSAWWVLFLLFLACVHSHEMAGLGIVVVAVGVDRLLTVYVDRAERADRADTVP
jgi:hypothetical protein